MAEPEIARRLRVINRLEELRAKHGRDIEQQPMPDWLDHLPEHIEQRIYASKIAPREATDALPPPEPPTSQPAADHVQRPSPRHPAQGRPADW